MEYIYRNLENIPVDIEYPDKLEDIDTIRKGDWLLYRGENRTFMPHTCHPLLSGKTYLWMFYRDETIYFVAAYASWMYNGEEVSDMRDYTQIYIEQIMCISQKEQFM